ncbi:MAG TPA: hypothetical protein VGI79_13235 [Caulobacteraceae bacterium]|jgi:hypothetical protein
MRALTVIATIAFALSVISTAEAAPCRDAKGKFMKCPPVAAKHCRDIKTKKFAKCSAAGTEPAPAKAG